VASTWTTGAAWTKRGGLQLAHDELGDVGARDARHALEHDAGTGAHLVALAGVGEDAGAHRVHSSPLSAGASSIAIVPAVTLGAADGRYASRLTRSRAARPAAAARPSAVSIFLVTFAPLAPSRLAWWKFAAAGLVRCEPAML